MERIVFTPAGERDFTRLPRQLQRRIMAKLALYLSTEHPLAFAKPLVNLPPATHRFRVGKYRICFYLERSTVIIDAIDASDDVYRKR